MQNLQGEMDRLVAKWEGFFAQLPAPYRPIPIRNLSITWNDRMRSRAGLCKPGEGIIELNPHLLTDVFILEEVLVHELCHMAVGWRWPRAQSHGEKWARLMHLCGLKPRRCHSLAPAKRRFHRRWELHCACRIHQVTTLVFNRISRGAKYRCMSCKTLLFRRA